MTITAENVAVASAAAPDKRRALGRGLESLLPGGARVVTGAAPAPASTVPPDGARPTVLPDVQAAAASTGSRVMQVPLDQIDENPYQTRQHFDSQALQELADSIRANGVVQPVVVRATPAGRFVLILGERRCRASKLAGKMTIPAIGRSVSDQQAAEKTGLENLPRQDLVDHTNNPMPKDPAAGAARWQDPNVREIQMQMERALGVRVRINDRNGKGKIVIEYATLEDFDRVVETLKGSG